METALADFIRETPQGREAEAILRKCVHCGFCTATCPTYQLLGDELDGPRGRIYLIKQMLEGGPVSARTQLHLDRCLTCRSCETTCPSGVKYSRLADIGREVVENKVGRGMSQQLVRKLLRALLPHPGRFGPLLRIGQSLRALMPSSLRKMVPIAEAPGPWPTSVHGRRMLVLDGCVQSNIAPSINRAAAQVLDRLGISLQRISGSGCCGAVSHHLAAPEEALGFMRRNIDAWWPSIESGAEAILVTSSACAAMVKEYAHLLEHDPDYAEKATRVTELARDVTEVLANENLTPLSGTGNDGRRVAFHSPCTLQHGQGITGVVETILRGAGFTLVPVANAHLCCGSAGTYSILQKELSQRLLSNKLAALQAESPDVIATANIGCLLHLRSDAHRPVLHWVQLLADPAAAAGNN